MNSVLQREDRIIVKRDQTSTCDKITKHDSLIHMINLTKLYKHINSLSMGCSQEVII